MNKARLILIGLNVIVWLTVLVLGVALLSAAPVEVRFVPVM